MKSSRGTGYERSWRRRSGVVSIRNTFPCDSIFTDCRSRLFRASSDVQTRQAHPTTGTPVEVPVPRKVTIMDKTLTSECRTQNEELRDVQFSSFYVLRSAFRLQETKTLLKQDQLPTPLPRRTTPAGSRWWPRPREARASGGSARRRRG